MNILNNVIQLIYIGLKCFAVSFLWYIIFKFSNLLIGEIYPEIYIKIASGISGSAMYFIHLLQSIKAEKRNLKYLSRPIDQIENSINEGDQFIVFKYVISVGVATFVRRSKVYYVRPNDSIVLHGWFYFLINITLGWWGWPNGIAYTILHFKDSIFGENVDADAIYELKYSENAYMTNYEKIRNLRLTGEDDED